MKIWGDEMSKIYVSCIDQLLKVTSAPTLASGGLNEVSVVFDFCEKWDGYIKTATFYREVDDVYYSVLDENDTCVVPWEVCGEDGSFYFSVFGEKGSTRRTASTVRYKVVKGAITSDFQPSDPTPELYDQILGIVNETKKEQETFVTECQETLQAAETAAELAEQRADDALEIAANAETIAKGRATGYVFDTKADMMSWLSDEANTAKLVVGDNLYIRDKGIPDYWWDGQKEQELETQKVDLAEYVKNTDYAADGKVGAVYIPNVDLGVYGIAKHSKQNLFPGGLIVKMASNSDIDGRKQQYKPIVPYNLDYAIKVGLTTNTETLTDKEKETALAWLGITDLIANLESRVAALENGGSNSNVLYIDGVEYQIETLGETWLDSYVWRNCDAECGNSWSIWCNEGENRVYSYIGSTCSGDLGGYISYGFLYDENGDDISCYAAPIPGYYYGINYVGEESDYYEENYASFTINGYEQTACSDYNWEANYSTMCPCPCGEEDLYLSTDSDTEEMRGECSQTGQKYRLVYMDGETPVSIYDYPGQDEIYYTQEV